MADHPFTQEEANKQSLIESIMSVYGLDEAEATEHYESGDWSGFNSTQAVQDRKEDEDLAGLDNRSVLSIPYDEDGKKRKGGKTVTQTNVPPGVDAPEIVVDGDSKSK